VPSCAEGGVLGVLPGLVGTIQATETIKLIVGAGEPLAGRLLLIDTLGMQFPHGQHRKDPCVCVLALTRSGRSSITAILRWCGRRKRGRERSGVV